MADITKSEILNTLKKLNDPNLKTDHLTLNSIKDFSLEKDSLKIEISIPSAEGSSKKKSSEKMVDAI
ncbi:MAG: DUF59 domain-containing protein, partial [Bacteroidetes bacterium]|nr:DUF59 domain-containing protein [Bacteroidota bacterium]